MSDLFKKMFHVQHHGWHSCAWLLAPMAVFIMGWLHWWVAAPLLGLMAAGLFYRRDEVFLEMPADYPQSLFSR